MRDAEKDLELCNRATPGPWYIQDEISHGTVRVWSKERVYRKIDNVDYQTWHIAESGCIDGKHGKIQLDNAKFIAESREALPYWIREAEEQKRLLEIAKLYLKQELLFLKATGLSKYFDFWENWKKKVEEFLGGDEG